MLDMLKIEATEQKNPLLYLDYEGSNLRIVLDNSNKPWLVIGDVCQILDIKEQQHILRKNSLRPFLAMAVLETPSGPYNLCLISQEGAERLFTLFDLHNSLDFLGWIREALSNVTRNGFSNPPKLDLDDLIRG